METFSASLALCEVNPPVTGGIALTKASNTELWCFLYLRLNKRLSKQSRRWWFETPSRPLWRHCNIVTDNKQGCLSAHFCCAGVGIFWACWISPIAVVASSIMMLTMWKGRVFVFFGSGSYKPVPFRSRRMIDYANIYIHVYQMNSVHQIFNT